jgi:hypothetical protein
LDSILGLYATKATNWRSSNPSADGWALQRSCRHWSDYHSPRSQITGEAGSPTTLWAGAQDALTVVFIMAVPSSRRKGEEGGPCCRICSETLQNLNLSLLGCKIELMTAASQCLNWFAQKSLWQMVVTVLI